MNKKAISMVIVGLIIAMIVLVLMSIFMGKIFTKSLKTAQSEISCSGKEGVCIISEESCPEGKITSIHTADCLAKDNKKCCIPSETPI